MRLLWVADHWRVRGRHWFYFSAQGDGTRCESVEELSGPTVTLAAAARKFVAGRR